jgi:hypothetical protein
MFSRVVSVARCTQFICHPVFVSFALFVVNTNEHAKASDSDV